MGEPVSNSSLSIIVVMSQYLHTGFTVTNHSFCDIPASVPAAVRSLTLAGRGTEDLRVTWSAAPGDVDHYEVQLLFSDMKVFPPITLGSNVGECVLSSLTPGRLYKILVSTFSGPNQKTQFIEGRTGRTNTVFYQDIETFIRNCRFESTKCVLSDIGLGCLLKKLACFCNFWFSHTAVFWFSVALIFC